jgi:lipopolysaccharide transport system ATP-binding protein
MSRPIIEVSNLSKVYRLGEIGANSLREEMTAFWTRLRGRKEDAAAAREFWALRDVSFSVQPGEVVGIIGRNGAGKSTLLKILSRITEPTSGRAVLRGRVASLLEVGTGFHPDLSGRDNIYLNGAILGMTKAEIRARFDEIVAFAEVEKFIDTPVKRYSSGMYVRLAFAVAAHLEPDILIVDEVLAVGDTLFQKKCLGRMDRVAREGRTVLFVSHNMGALRQLCHRGVLLESGTLRLGMSPIEEAVAAYSAATADETRFEATFTPDPEKLISITRVSAAATRDGNEKPFSIADPLTVSIDYRVTQLCSGINLALTISREGIPLINSFDIEAEPTLFERREAGSYSVTATVPARLLKAGRYSLSVDAGRTSIGSLDHKPDALAFEVDDSCEDTTHKGYARYRQGLVIAPVVWRTRRTAD